MENKEKHIDQILLNKAYNELSAEEFLVIKDEITSESEYNDLRTMLIAASNELANAEEIEPKADTKAFLMKEFAKVHPATRTRSGGLGFLFPKDKTFFQKPGYQLIAVAAVILLIFTIYPKLTETPGSNNDMAQHTVDETDKSKEPKKDINNEKSESDLTNNDTEVVDEVSLKEEKVVTGNQQEVISNPSDKVKGYVEADLKVSDYEGSMKDQSIVADGASFGGNETMPPPPTVEEEPMADEYAEDELMDVDDMLAVSQNSTGSNEVNNTSNNGATTTSLDMDATAGASEDNELAVVSEIEAAEEATSYKKTSERLETVSKAIAKEKENNKFDSAPGAVKKSKSLAENAELIDLFYTAM